MGLFLGIDGGGTSTAAVAINDLGQTVFTGSGGPSNIARCPMAQIFSSLQSALEGCPEICGVAGCFAGMTSGENADVKDWLTTRFPEAKIDLMPDYAALAGCVPKGTTVVVAGTGSVIVTGGARLRVSGGGGALLGDLGSAFDIGRRALAVLGFGPEPVLPSQRLASSLLEAFGTGDPRIIAGNSFAPGFVERVAGLAADIGQDQADGHDYANTVVNEAMISLVIQLKRHLAGANEPKVALSGGLWKSSNAYEKTFLSHAAELVPDMEFVSLERTPAEGAARLAMQMKHGN